MVGGDRLSFIVRVYNRFCLAVARISFIKGAANRVGGVAASPGDKAEGEAHGNARGDWGMILYPWHLRWWGWVLSEGLGRDDD